MLNTRYDTAYYTAYYYFSILEELSIEEEFYYIGKYM